MVEQAKKEKKKKVKRGQGSGKMNEQQTGDNVLDAQKVAAGEWQHETDAVYE